MGLPRSGLAPSPSGQLADLQRPLAFVPLAPPDTAGSLTPPDTAPPHPIGASGRHPTHRRRDRAPLPRGAASPDHAPLAGGRARRRPSRVRPAGFGPVRPTGRGGTQPRPGAPRPRPRLPVRVDRLAALRHPRAVRGLQQGPQPAAHRGAALVPRHLGHQPHGASVGCPHPIRDDGRTRSSTGSVARAP